MAKRTLGARTEQGATEEVQTEEVQTEEVQTEEVPTVRFENSVSWAGDNFSYIAGDVLELPKPVALARAEAGMGRMLDEE
jgi:hypothetical protein